MKNFVKSVSVLSLITLLSYSCSTSTGAKNVTIKKTSLANTEWKLLTEDNQLVKGFNGENVTLTIDINTNKAKGFAGCNMYQTNVNINQNQIVFNEVTSTDVTCPNYKIENSFMQLLDDANRFEVRGNELYLYKNNILLFKFIQ